MVTKQDIEYCITHSYFETEEERLAYLYAIADGQPKERMNSVIYAKQIKELFKRRKENKDNE